VLALAAVWGAALLLAPPAAGWGWALSGFRSIALPARLGLLAAVAAVAAVTGLATRRPRGRWTWALVAVAVALCLAFPLRERIHLLGDTDTRLRAMEGFAAGTPGVTLSEWARRIHAAPLDLAVDFLLPAGMVRAGLDSAGAMSWLSFGLALAFLAGLHRLLVGLRAAPGSRPGLLAALALAGALQAFAGYAEVAGLVLVTVVWWWVALLGPLDTRGRAIRAALAWLAVLLAHRIGLALLPALLWRAVGPALPGDRPGARRWLLAGSALAAGVAYALWRAGGVAGQTTFDVKHLLAGGQAPSAARLLDFANALLLVAPLALAVPFVAGPRAVAAWARDRRVWLVALAALPLPLVHWLGIGSANGLGAYRDWDLGVALNATTVAGAALLLVTLPVGRLRAGLMVMVPVLALQAGSWIAVHADEAASVARADALVPRLPPAQRGTLCLFLGQRAMDAGDPALAARRYEQAFDLTPDPETGVLAAETWLLARDMEGARRMIARAGHTGTPLQATRGILAELDSLIARYDRRAREVAGGTPARP
jgi:hypothetical protein